MGVHESVESSDVSGLLAAEELVLALGPLSTLYTASIRAVRSAPAILKTDSPEKIQKFSVEAVGFPVKVSPTFKSAFYFYAQERDESELSLAMPLNYIKLLSLFSHDEMLAVLSLTYIYRLLSRRCDLEEWNRLMPKLGVHMQIGGYVGEKIEGVGFGNGMFIAGVRLLSQALLLFHNVQGYKQLRRNCESKGLLFDCKGETELWRCNHLEVASMLVSALGYGVGPRMAFGVNSQGLMTGPLQNSGEAERIEVEAWRATIAATEALHSKGSIPPWLREQPQFSDVEAVAELERRTIGIVAKGTGFEWMHKSVSDLPEDIQLQLGIRMKDRRSAEKARSGEEESL